jgi:hypothetical protein
VRGFAGRRLATRPPGADRRSRSPTPRAARKREGSETSGRPTCDGRRVSVGIEHIDDIIEDLDQALVSAGALVTV